MKAFLVRRALIGLAQVAILLLIVFVLSLLLPGDAADVQAGDLTSAEQRAETRGVLGLDVAPMTRFATWLAGAAHGDLGTSWANGLPVTQVIAAPLLMTALTALLTTVLLVPVAFGAGLWAGLRPGSVADRVITTVAITTDSVPDFVLAVLLVAWLAVGWQLFPATFVGADALDVLTHPAYLVLPLTVLVCRMSAPLVRLVRAGVIDQQQAPYLEQARRLGIPRWSLVLRHLGPNALAPAVQELGRTGDSLLSGVLIVEAIFVIPGLATAMLDAIGNRDEPVILAVLLATGLLAIAINTLIDIAGGRMVPRRLRA